MPEEGDTSGITPLNAGISKKDVIVCLPVLNEELSIEEMVGQIRNLGLDLLISDGGSVDNSLHIAERLGVHILHRPGKGKGYGMQQALEYASGIQKKYIVFLDCDMTYPVESIPDLLDKASHLQAAMVLGARNFKDMSLKSVLLNRMLVCLFNVFIGKGLSDPATGFRLLRINDFRHLLTEEGMLLELEISAVALRQGMSTGEVQIPYHPRRGESKLSFSDLADTWRVLFKLWRKKT